CWIPPGQAMLGSPAAELERRPDETEHEYITKGFWLAKYPVTQEQWLTVMGGKNPSHFSEEGSGQFEANGLNTRKFPVETVSWNECQDFVKRLSDPVKPPAAMGAGQFALPHEDQWEYACRGGKGNKQPFYFGDQLNGKQANCDGNAPYGTATKGPFL